MMDVERVVATRLMGATGIGTVLEVPERRPSEFVSVELTSSSGGRFIRTCVLAVQAWAPTRRRAREMALALERAIYDLTDESNIFRAVPTNVYRWPDPDSRQERYQITVEVTVCE